MELRIVDVTDEASFALLPPCADPRFDHRSCDYWEDADRGSKVARPIAPVAPGVGPAAGSAAGPTTVSTRQPAAAFNPFAPAGDRGPAFNPFAPAEDRLADNPFAPQRPAPRGPAADAPRKLALLARGAAVFGSYAKVLLVDDRAVVFAQFGPLSAYPRAARVRELYRQLPDAPLPAVITCVATTAEARHGGHARHLVEAVCDDLAGRGFAAVEAYPEIGTSADSTSAATPAFWLASGFALAVDDDRFPVMRREL
ncbi:MAG: GNAT family N-acetyltransferase [Candidatus Limnocylindrales bacterium]